MPMTSLPSPYGVGTMGREAFRFVDFLAAAGQKYWQMLPVGPISYGDSPYQSFSTFAGNPYYVDLELLAEDGLLTAEEIAAADGEGDPGRVDYGWLYEHRFPLLQKAFARGRTRDRAALDAAHRQAAALLAGTNLLTKDVIAENTMREKYATLMALMPDAADFTDTESGVVIGKDASGRISYSDNPAVYMIKNHEQPGIPNRIFCIFNGYKIITKFFDVVRSPNPASRKPVIFSIAIPIGNGKEFELHARQALLNKSLRSIEGKLCIFAHQIFKCRGHSHAGMGETKLWRKMDGKLLSCAKRPNRKKRRVPAAVAIYQIAPEHFAVHSP